MSAGRPSSAVEYVFLLTKSPSYFFDAEAVRRGCRSGPSDVRKMVDGYERFGGKHKHLDDPLSKASVATNIGRRAGVGSPTGRNLRNSDLWFESVKAPHGMVMVGDEPVGLDITSEALKLKHFAAFPTRFVATCLKAGTSHKGVCPACGAPWVRVLSKERVPTRPGLDTKINSKTWNAETLETIPGRLDGNAIGNRDPGRHVTESRTVGWRASCECDAGEPVPATALDPFTGSGTTGVVCRRMGLAFIGCEASPEYAEMARRRIANPEPEPEAPQISGQERLFDDA
jgi:hypothetical protein